jgi:hypothetical protein
LLIVYVPEFFGTRHSSAEPFEQQVLRQSAPDWHIGIFGLTVHPLVPFPFASPTRFSSSVQKARIRVTPTMANSQIMRRLESDTTLDNVFATGRIENRWAMSALAGLPNRIELSERFWEEVRAHPIPSELNVVRGLANSPGCLDFYLWLTWRCHLARGDEKIGLFGPTGLQVQLGSDDYLRARDFRRTFGRWLTTVRACWPECPVRLAPDGETLHISPASAIHKRL